MLVHKHDNLFDVVRIFAAFLVIYSHHYVLSGMQEPVFLNIISYGGLAVIIFFSISGYLIAKSAQSTKNASIFLKKRINRIFPGLVFCACISYILIIPIFTHNLPCLSNIVNVLRMSLLYRTSDMGVTSTYIYPNSFNGSLWTLPLEFLCYIVVGFIVIYLDAMKSIFVAIFITFLICIYLQNIPSILGFYGIALQQLMPLLLSFLSGAALALTNCIYNKKNKYIFILLSLIILYAMYDTFELFVLFHLLAPMILIPFCLLIKDRVILGRFDYSYGTYIYAFPIQQIIINKLHIGFYSGLILSVIITLFFAAMSWHFIESKFLRR